MCSVTATKKPERAAAAVMSIEGEVYGEGSDGEEVFIDDEDIINEIPLDEEGLPIQVPPILFNFFALCLLLALPRSP